ncbi:MAG: tetratricopeptide repeat protein, partial [Phycisphaerales bacterium]
MRQQRYTASERSPLRQSRHPEAQAPPRRRTWLKARRRALIALAGLLLPALIWADQVELISLDTAKTAVLGGAARLYPNKAVACAYISETHNSAGRSKEAVRICEKLVAVRPDDASSHALLGSAYCEAGRSQEAIGSFSRAIKLDPNSFDAHFGLGETYSALGRLDDAIKLFEKAVAIEPRSAGAYLSLGLAYSKSGRYEEAMHEFRQAKELDPQINELHVL